MMKLALKTQKSFAIFLIIFFGNQMLAMACEACKQNQPTLLKDITHGNGPQSNWDYFIVIIMVLVAVYSLFATIKCFVKPAEKQYSDIKNIILKQQ